MRGRIKEQQYNDFDEQRGERRITTGLVSHNSRSIVLTSSTARRQHHQPSMRSCGREA